MTVACDPAAARTLETLAAVQRQLADLVARLERTSACARGLADQTRWRTDAATRFHDSAAAWRRDVAALPAALDGVNDEIGLLRARVEAYAWRYGV